jgi:C4-dicarboxylate-specific signal transduction histidine kinase
MPLRRAVEGALALVGASLRDAGVAVEVALDPPPGPVVLAQLVPLEQVLANLLGNARDAFASRPPEAPRQVRISSCTDPRFGQVRIIVEDTAGGLPQAVLDRLFEPFVTTKDAEKGTGLGLSICHGLVRGMGGSIEAHNGEAGAVFTITLAATPELAEAATPVTA